MKTPLFPTAGAPCLTRGARADSITPSQKRTCVLDVDPSPGGPRLPLVERILTRTYPFSKLRGSANVLIFPNLDAANVSYKLLSRVGGAEAIGPILVGMAQPVHVLQRGSDVNDIVNMAVIAAVDAQEHGRRSRA